jgi:protein O-GlcNAc transferase
MFRELNATMQNSQTCKVSNTQYKKGYCRKVLQACDRALSVQPKLVAANLLKAQCLVNMGELVEARKVYAKTLRLDPSNFNAWLEAGNLCTQMGELEQAAMAYQQAMEVAPQRYEVHLAMALVMAKMGKSEPTNEAYHAAIQYATHMGDEALGQVHWQMGKSMLELGHAQESLACFAFALESSKTVSAAGPLNFAAEVLMDAGAASMRLGNKAQAMEFFTSASTATQEATLTRLSMVSYQNNFWNEAVSVARRCVTLHPLSQTAHWNLANMLVKCWRMAEAEGVLQQAEQLAPVPDARALRAEAASLAGDVEKALALYIELANESKGEDNYASRAAITALHSDVGSSKEVAALHRRLFVQWGEGARTRDSFVRKPFAGRRVRLGLVVADLVEQHSVNTLLQPLLRELDRSRFEMTVYFVGDTQDTQTELARSRAEHWVNASVMNNRQLANKIDADEIDVLVNMTGHANQERMQLFAQRAAPVQMSYLGYPGSTGVPNIDFVLGDNVVTPQGCDAMYSEQVLRLPNTVFCFAPDEHFEFPTYTAAHAARPLTFGSFNDGSKLTTQTLKLWARVMAQVPTSRLVLNAPTFADKAACAVFANRLTALGVDAARVEFRASATTAEMMAAYADIDIALDPVPYNGDTTTLQAMWMGVPVLTKLGSAFASRMGASAMQAAGLNDWVATDDDAYVAIAQHMAAHRAELLALKKGMRLRLQALPAWNAEKHTRAVEAAWLTRVL